MLHFILKRIPTKPAPASSYEPTISSRARRNIRLVTLEHAISEGLICMSILTPFYRSIGMSYAEVTLSQAIFTIAVLLLDVPMGYLADRFSRKWANVIGDFGSALFHFFYAFATNFIMVVSAEIGLGIFYSLTSGVDAALLRHFVKKAGGNEDAYSTAHARMILYGNVIALPLVLLGGPLGAISFRLAIFLSGVPRLVAGIISLFIEDDSARLKRKEKNALSDIVRVARNSLQNRELAPRIFAYAVIREMSHPVVWILTPILLQANVPLKIVSAAWAIDSVMRMFGNKLAEKVSSRLSPFWTAFIPVAALSVSLLTLAFDISLFTVWIYLLSGLACGWTGVALIPLVQEKALTTEQTTVISVAKTFANLLYIPTVYLTGIIADISLNLACGVIVLVYVPLSIAVLIAIRRTN